MMNCSIKLFLVLIGASSASGARLELPSLPYKYDELQPVISERTLATHHTKHHAKYVNTANQLIHTNPDKSLRDLTPEQIIESKEIQQTHVALYNNVAQSWNHAFYWNCMAPPSNGGGGVPNPRGVLASMIAKGFGSYTNFRSGMEDVAVTTFGSGWAWLCYDAEKERLVMTKTVGAGNPLMEGVIPILTIDVWEHAYYLDYQERRAAYVTAFFDRLVNWSFVEENLKRAIESSTSSGEDEL